MRPAQSLFTSPLIVMLFMIGLLAGCNGGGGHSGLGGGGANNVININGDFFVAGTQSGPNLTFTQGTTASLVIVLTNIGNLASDQLVTVTLTLPTGITYGGSFTSTTPGWTCNASGQTITCTNPASIAGLTGTSTFSVQLNIAANAAGPASLSGSVSTPDGSPNSHSGSKSVIFNSSAPAPNISSLNPNSGPVGTAVTISGSNFGSSQGSSTVTFNGTSAGSASSWSSTSITLDVPAGATSGNVIVTVGGVLSNGVAFTVTTGSSPNITSLNPTSGPVGTFVTISGSNFGSAQGSSTVTFNGTTATTVSSWSATSIVVDVPNGATTGNVVVHVGAASSNGVAFTVTTVSVSCPSPVSFTLCGLYAFGMRGVNASGGPTAMGATFVADNSGNVLSGTVFSNDSVNGFKVINVGGGSYAMNSPVDGRGQVTLKDRAGAIIGTFRFVLQSGGSGSAEPIEEFDASGNQQEGLLFGPEASPVSPTLANTTFALNFVGANGGGKKVGLLGLAKIGSVGCNNAGGGFSSFEPFVTNSGGTVDSGINAGGSCTAPDQNGVGAASLTLGSGSSGPPFAGSNLDFIYIAIVSGGGLQGAFFLTTNPVGTNQPLLTAFATPGVFFGGGGLGTVCPCLFATQGSTNGTVARGTAVASLVRITATGTNGSGTLSGVVDENAAGTITSAASWPYTSYLIDANGVGTITATGQPTIHFVLDVNSDFWTLDESAQVNTGAFRNQNSTSLEGAPNPYTFGSVTGSPTTTAGDILGVITPSGGTSGTFSGTADLINDSGLFTASVSGSYAGIDPTTGRGTGTITLTANGTSKTTNIVIYAFRHVIFLVLDVSSNNPDVELARLQ